MSKRRFEEAALLFKRANNIALALQCYQSVQNWKGVAGCGQIMNMEKKALNNLLQKMVANFESRRKYTDVAEILSFIDEKVRKKYHLAISHYYPLIL